MELQGYKISKKIHESKNTVIYRGKKIASPERSVIIKHHLDSYWQMAALNNIKNSYSRIPKSINNFPNLLATEMVDRNIVTVYSDMGGVDLNKYRTTTQLSISDLLEVSINIAMSIEFLHNEKIVHGNICPQNIIVNSSNNNCHLIDLDASFLCDTHLDKVNYFKSAFAKVDKRYCAIEYFSFDKEIGYHSDLFSFGMLLYELFTGVLLDQRNFENGNSYPSINESILPPSKINSAIPHSISEIIVKCISQTPSKRYLSITALKIELEKCSSDILSYTPARKLKDNAELRLSISGFHQKCRISEVDILKDVYSRCTTGSAELVFLEGPQKIGKQKLVEVFASQYEKIRYNTLSLEYQDTLNDDNQIDIFVNAIVSIIKGLTITESEVLKARISQSELQGQQLCLANPEFSSYFSEETETAPSKHRLINELVELLVVVSDEEMPILINILFSERLSSALALLIESVYMCKKRTNVMLVLSYNTNTLGPNSYLSLLLRSISTYRSQRSSVETHIRLSQVSVGAIEKILEETFSPTDCSHERFSHLLYAISKGYPETIVQYLDELMFNNQVYLNEENSRWQWDILKLEKEFQKSNEKRSYVDIKWHLSELEIIILSVLACSGVPLDKMEILGYQTLVSENDLENVLDSLVQMNLISHTNIDNINTYQMARENISVQVFSTLDTMFSKSVHLRILEKLFIKKEAVTAENICFIADQLFLHQGQEYCSRMDYIRIALYAGYNADDRKDKSSSNLHLINAYTLISEEDWEVNYDVAYNISILLLNALLTTNQHERFDEIAQYVRSKSKCINDESNIVELIVTSNTTQGQHARAIAVGREHLGKLNYKLPTRHYLLHTIILFISVYLRLLFNPIHKIKHIPIAQNQRTKTILSITQKIGTAAYTSEPDLLPVISIKGALHSLKHGVTPETTQCLMICALILLVGFKSPKYAYKYKDIAFELAKRFPEKRDWMDGVLGYYFNGLIRPWRDSLVDCENKLSDIFRQTVIMKDYETAAFANSTYFATCVTRGHELTSLERKLEVSFPQVEMFNQANQRHLHRIIWQMVRNLSKPCAEPMALNGEVYNEDRYRDFHESQKDKTVSFCYFYCKLMIAVIFNDYDEAISLYKKGNRIIKGAFGLPYITGFHMYYTLSVISKTDFSSIISRLLSLLKIIPNRFRFIHYKNNSAINFGHLHLLHRAEFYTLLPFGSQKSKRLYIQAKKLALESNRNNDVALITERQIEFLSKIGETSQIQKELAREAVHFYQKAGYHAKAIKLTNFYELDKADKPTDDSSALLSLYPVFERISLQKNNDSILEDAIAIETATLVGAESCVLILRDSAGNYRARSRFQKSSGRVTRYSTSYTEFHLSSATIIKQALNNKSEFMVVYPKKSNLIQDPYFNGKEIVAVAAIPIKNGDNSILGVIYLEYELDYGLYKQNMDLAKMMASFVVTPLEYAILLRRKIEADDETSEMRKYIAKVCHEMNSPTHTIVTALQHLQAEVKFPNTNEFYTHALVAARQLMRISKDTIDYEKIKNRTLPLHPSHFSLRDLIVAAYDPARLKIAGRNVNLRFPNTAHVYDHYNNDKLRILQILNNLIGNAVKFTTEGYIACDLEVISTNDNEEVIEISISNTGPQIPKEYRASIFEEYTQADSSSTRKTGGSGLGLAIVKDLTEYMGGKVSMESSPEITTFSFSLPLNKVSEDEFNAMPLEIEGDSWRNLDLDNLMLDRNIVVVDDDNALRFGLVKTLKDLGASVVDFELPLEALKYILDNRIDLLLTDIEMPNYDGYALTKEIRRNNIGNEELPIMAITGHRVGDIEQRCIASGMDGYIGKPFMIEDLAVKLADVFRIKIPRKMEVTTSISPNVEMPILCNQKHINLLHPLLQLHQTEERVVSNLIEFLEEQHKVMKSIRSNIQNKKYKLARFSAHGLKNTFENIGAFKMLDLVYTIERDVENIGDEQLDRMVMENESVLKDVEAQFEYLKSMEWDLKLMKVDSPSQLFEILKEQIDNDRITCNSYGREISMYFTGVDLELTKVLLQEITDSDLDSASVTLELLRKTYKNEVAH